MEKMCCPKCKTNRSRFYMIEQIPKAVKISPETAEVVEEYSNGMQDPFFVNYNGPEYRVQCGVCGLVENPEVFIAAGKH